jgi:hypothetical protein
MYGEKMEVLNIMGRRHQRNNEPVYYFFDAFSPYSIPACGIEPRRTGMLSNPS